MYVAMNRFRVHAGHEEAFEVVWQARNRYAEDVTGFQAFHLLRGETTDGITPYVSHSTWDSPAAFDAWRKSDAFRKAHEDARSPKGTLDGHPEFSGWEAVLEE